MSAPQLYRSIVLRRSLSAARYLDGTLCNIVTAALTDVGIDALTV
jgi:hypothetical protein